MFVTGALFKLTVNFLLISEENSISVDLESFGDAWEAGSWTEVVGCEVDDWADDIEDSNTTVGWLEVKCFFKFEVVDL